MTTKTCVTCKHCNRTRFLRLYECRHPSSGVGNRVDVVTGKLGRTEYHSCDTMRHDWGNHDPDDRAPCDGGKLWELK